jgi:MFS family permease
MNLIILILHSAMALFCAFTMVGPTFAPFITGYISASPAGWRMAFWLGVMVAGVSFIPLLFLCPETYGPILLVRKAQKMRKAGNKDAIAPLELDERSLLSIFGTTLTRPFRMFWQESIVFLTSMFLALLYGTFYLFFTSYPLIFQGQLFNKLHSKLFSMILTPTRHLRLCPR